MNLALFALHFVVGVLFFAHGAQKVFGLWGGTGIAGFATNLEGLGYQQATTLSWLTGVTELVAGAFLVLGLLTPHVAGSVPLAVDRAFRIAAEQIRQFAGGNTPSNLVKDGY